MGSLLDQLKGGMSKPGKRAKAGGSKGKIKKSPPKKSKAGYTKGSKVAPRTQARSRFQKVNPPRSASRRR